MIWVETVDALGRHMIQVDEDPVEKAVQVEVPVEVPVKEEAEPVAPPEFEEVVKKTRTRKAKA